jgi:hypothetical protein
VDSQNINLKDLGPALLLRIAQDTAAIQRDVSYLREGREEDRREREALEKKLEAAEARLDTIERSSIRLHAMATALALPLFWILDWLKDRIHFVLPLALLFLAGCAPVEKKWHEQLVPVLIDRTMPPECVAASLDAIEFWADHGVDYLAPGLVVPAQLKGKGNVTITLGEVPADKVAMTVVSSNEHEGITRARISLKPGSEQACELHTLAHELGHALGLVHNDEPDSLMFHASEYSMFVFPDEVERVR